MEINGHEWWSWDGKTVWFDLQTPRSQVFWIAGVEMATGRKIRYHVERDWWGVHFNSSRDNTLFASDGGDAFAGGVLDRRHVDQPASACSPADRITREKLVNMSKHNYVTGRGGVEPNVHITPDKKWVVFTGQFAGGHAPRLRGGNRWGKAGKIAAPPRTSSTASTIGLHAETTSLPSHFAAGARIGRRSGDECRAGTECRPRARIQRNCPAIPQRVLCQLPHRRKGCGAAGPAAILLGGLGRAGFCEVGSRARQACRAPDAAQASEAARGRRAPGRHQLDSRHLEDGGAQE